MSVGTVHSLATESDDVFNSEHVETESNEEPRTVIDSLGCVQPKMKAETPAGAAGPACPPGDA